MPAISIASPPSIHTKLYDTKPVRLTSASADTKNLIIPHHEREGFQIATPPLSGETVQDISKGTTGCSCRHRRRSVANVLVRFAACANLSTEFLCSHQPHSLSNGIFAQDVSATKRKQDLEPSDLLPAKRARTEVKDEKAKQAVEVWQCSRSRVNPNKNSWTDDRATAKADHARPPIRFLP